MTRNVIFMSPIHWGNKLLPGKLCVKLLMAKGFPLCLAALSLPPCTHSDIIMMMAIFMYPPVELRGGAISWALRRWISAQYIFRGNIVRRDIYCALVWRSWHSRMILGQGYELRTVLIQWTAGREVIFHRACAKSDFTARILGWDHHTVNPVARVPN